MIIVQTPLRISLLGGNTDFADFYLKHGGAVLTTAIDKYIYCIITDRLDSDIYVNWSKKEIAQSVGQVEHDLVREALKKTGVKGGVEITFLSDIPSKTSGGSGLGSSSSVTVGVLNALYHYTGQIPTVEQLATEAVEIEVSRLQKPIGIQDQYIAAYGGLRFFEFGENGRVKQEKLPISNGSLEDLDNSLMLFYTHRMRKSSDILTAVKKNIPQKIKTLLATKELAYEGKKAVLSGNIAQLGLLLDQYWQLKKSLSKNISDTEIDLFYQKAKKAGAIGGKIVGAGGGGFMLLVVPSGKRQLVRNALVNFAEMPFHLERDGSKVIFNVRRY
ncbi:GHMP kinase [Candidatus Microgenomates bacterium]|nr:GHMP kinase [Candidatus Microgenomates bacterium]